MKKYFLSLVSIIFSLAAFAQNSAAYDAGYKVGKGIGMLLVTGLIIWGAWRLTRNKKK